MWTKYLVHGGAADKGWHLGPDPVVSMQGPPCHLAAVYHFTPLDFLLVIGKTALNTFILITSQGSG